jgi:hypothetical protein
MKELTVTEKRIFIYNYINRLFTKIINYNEITDIETDNSDDSESEMYYNE